MQGGKRVIGCVGVLVKRIQSQKVQYTLRDCQIYQVREKSLHNMLIQWSGE